MNIKQLEAFVHISEEKNFTKAAKLMYMTQPAISFQIKALEDHLDIQLFERMEKKVFLTEGGKILYPHAKNILVAYEKVKEDLTKLKGIEKGTLVIGASTIPGEYVLPKLIGEFKAKHPGLVIILEIGSTIETLTKLEERKIDIAIVGANPENGKFTSFKITQDELVLIHSPGFKHDIIDIERLKNLPFIFREPGSGTRKIIEQKLTSLGILPEELNIQMQLGSTRAIITAVESGLGVSFLSSWAIKEALQLGKIKVVKVKGLHIERYLYGAMNPNKFNSNITKAFYDLIQSYYKKQ